MNQGQKICLTIAGVDPSGGAGIIADIKTFSAFGCFATAAVTSLTYQNTQGVFGAENQTAESVRRQIEPILDDFDISAAKTGMLPNREVIEAVAKIIKENKLKKLVVDPVVRSTSGFDLIGEEALRSLIEKLFPLALVITPNIPEAERISQIKIKTQSDVEKAAGIMQKLGAKNVLIKGGHFETSEVGEQNSGIAKPDRIATDFLFIGNDLEILEAKYIETSATHGTGCTLAAAITANLALGKDLTEAVRIAKEFVNQAISNAPHIGKGHSPIGIFPNSFDG
jgi:hydroxymethylpyrimidine kinase/phosphomethylpyrimidine kinase